MQRSDLLALCSKWMDAYPKMPLEQNRCGSERSTKYVWSMDMVPCLAAGVPCATVEFRIVPVGMFSLFCLQNHQKLHTRTSKYLRTE